MARNFAAGNYIELPASMGFLGDVIFTLSFWWRSTLNNQWEIFGRHDASGSFNGFGLEAQPGTPVQLSYYAKNGSAGLFGLGPGSVINAIDGNWHSCVVRINRNVGGANDMTVDGSIGANVATPSAWGFNSVVARVGRSIDSFWQSYAGDFAEFAWWSARLSDEEVKALCRGIPARRVRPGALDIYLPLRT